MLLVQAYKAVYTVNFLWYICIWNGIYTASCLYVEVTTPPVTTEQDKVENIVYHHTTGFSFDS